jgi:hypothetical protein
MPEYVMSAAGDDNAVGTAAAPFRTIERGIQKLSGPGDVLVIRGGVYPERMNLICKKGDANAPIQIRGEAGEQVFATGPSRRVRATGRLPGGRQQRVAPGERGRPGRPPRGVHLHEGLPAW